MTHELEVMDYLANNLKSRPTIETISKQTNIEQKNDKLATVRAVLGKLHKKGFVKKQVMHNRVRYWTTDRLANAYLDYIKVPVYKRKELLKQSV